MVLSTLKNSAEAYLGKPVRDAVITVPAYFNDSQRQATKDAGKIAGLNVRRIINEPTAGALAFGLDKTEEEERNVLMFDVGGGTFDVSILSIDSGIFEVRAVDGDSTLGGEDFDTRLVEYCVEEFTRKYGLDLSSDRKALRRLRSACEHAKRMLSSATNATIALDALHGGIDFHTVITRARFEEVNQDLFQKIQDVLPKVLRDAKMSKEDIHEVVLIGGSTRIPYIQQMVKAFFGKEPSKTVNPDEAVACGAAIQAILIAERDPSVIVPEIVLVDVAHLSLGIKQYGDTMSVIIKRNTTIPTKKTERYSTAVDNQTVIPISVYEGENHIVSHNNLLGEFTMSGLPRLPRGQAKVYVTFEIDADGILHVSAVNDITKNSKHVSITTNKGRLSQEQLLRLVREAEIRNRGMQARTEAAQARNELEGLCIRVKDKAETLLAWLANTGDKAQAKHIADKRLELEMVLRTSLKK
ncbi:heat shock 70 kDa protein cognate 4-like [Hyposmocoma kahamanoa]|uniref:heat shock 70 kDa protein cognate 4-like n=1 Tax=Hyposmocoma kahamanoa TaxID=1477025 RepID=UPI000E6D7B93|nr:heat shock 70 kDa protein cognate 4-like [Hyposmocoma kahamanoa]